MKKLLSILASVGMVGTVGATVVSCKDTKKEEENTREALTKKIGEVETTKNDIKEKTGENWGGVVASAEEKLNAVITGARQLAEDEAATEEQIKDTKEALDKAITSFGTSLPESIVAEAINKQKEDIKGLFDKNWSYSSFWNMDSEKGEDGNARIMDIFYGSVREIATNYGYSKAEVDKLAGMVLTWTQESVNLVYIDVDADGKQEISFTVENGSESDKTIDEIFIENVKKNYKDELEDGEIPEGFFEKHNLLSLGITFKKDAENRKLAAETKEFWTFTFVTDLKQETIQEIINDIEADIEFNIEKGLDKFSTFKDALDKQFKCLFYGKHYLQENLVLHYDKAPSDEQIKDGIDKWNEGLKEIEVSFNLVNDKDEETRLFEINAKYMITIE